MPLALDPNWTNRAGNPSYNFQVVSEVAEPPAGWGGVASQMSLAAYAQTMLFSDHTTTGTVSTPASDDIALLFVRSSNNNQAVLWAYNNAPWVIAINTGTYASLATSQVAQAASTTSPSYVHGDTITLTAKGNSYIAYHNSTEVLRWVDTAGAYAPNVNATQNQVAIGYLWGAGSTGGFDNWTADDLFIWPSLSGTTGGGALSATALIGVVPGLAGAGALSASAFFYSSQPQFTGAGALSATAYQYALAPAALAGDGALSAAASKGTPVSAALAGDGALSATAYQYAASAAGFTGVGGLSATAVASYASSGALTGAGTLSATAVGHPNVIYSDVGAGGTGSGATASWSHTIAGNCLVVILTNGTNTAPTVKVGTTTVPAVTSTILCGNFSGFNCYVTAFALMNPPTGAQTIAVTNGGNYVSGQSMSYNNVGSIGTAVTTASGSGSPSVSVSSAAGNYVAQGFGTTSNNPSAYNQTMRYSNTFVSFAHWGTMIGDAAGATSVAFSCTAGSGSWGSVAVPMVRA